MTAPSPLDHPRPALMLLHYVQAGEPPYAPTPELAEAIADLTDDGDTHTLSDGRTLRLGIRPDDVSPMEQINDADCWGRVAWGVRVPGERWERRPDGFDGAARKLADTRDGSVWWQPPGPEVIGPVPWDAETLRAEGAKVAELIEDGFSLVSLRVIETVADSLGHEHSVELAATYLGGVDKFYPELIAEMAGELESELTPAEAAAS